MKLNELITLPGAKKSRKRVGRGIGSGKGKTSGAGGKGQTARSGVAIGGFEGGQMPLHRRLPKRGFNSYRPTEYATLNFDRLQKAFDNGVVTESDLLDEKTLLERGLISRIKHGVKILAKGKLTAKLQLKVTTASQSAVKALEESGSKITINQ